MGLRKNRKPEPEEELFIDEKLPLAGTLISSFDARSGSMHSDFRALETARKDALSSHQTGDLPRVNLLEFLSQLVILDNLGTEWSLGATSSKWYSRRAGSREWVSSGMPLSRRPRTLPAFTLPDVAASESTAPASAPVDSNMWPESMTPAEITPEAFLTPVVTPTVQQRVDSATLTPVDDDHDLPDWAKSVQGFVDHSDDQDTPASHEFGSIGLDDSHFA